MRTQRKDQKPREATTCRGHALRPLIGLALLSSIAITFAQAPPDSWSQKADMPTARLAAAAAVVGGRIYVIGGLTSVGPGISTVEAYDPATDTWERKTPMPTPRGLLCAAAVDGKIFAVGGSVPLPNGPWFNTAEMYDPAADTWASKASMPTALGALGCGTAYGRIYVIGGRSQTTFATTGEYNPATDTWTTRADLPVGTAGLAASEVNDRVFILGGYTSTLLPAPGVASVFEYTPPITEPTLNIHREKQAGQTVLRLEWLSRADCTDSLQFRSLSGTGAWAEVQMFPGTNSSVIFDVPDTEPSGFYRLQRGLK